MSMVPHWLDEVFGKGKGDVEATTKALVEHKQFKASMDAGAFGFREAQRRQEQEGPRPGSDPNQHARSRFLEEAHLATARPEESGG